MLLFYAATASAQNKQAQQTYNAAVELLSNGLIKEAIPGLIKATEQDASFMDAWYSLAGAYGEVKDYPKAISTFEIAQQKDPVGFHPFLLSYSINLAGDGRFADALNAVKNFLANEKLNDRSRKSGEYRKKTYEFALEYAASHPASSYKFNPQNLGDSINSRFAEYYPSITINDSMFVYTRRNGNREDFMESTIRGSSGYSKAKEIDGSINNEPFKGAINISQDGEWLVFAGNFRSGYGNFDLYISYYTPQGWSEPINLGESINTEFWETAPSLSPDKRALYFTSNRPGGHGGSDLYVSYRQLNGKWGKAVNMGPGINTIGDELAPFIHADNQNLYFTSTGLPGYGGSDLYVARKKNTREWHTPENLGFPINTIDNEGSLFIAANGIDAYYASDRFDSRGALDLYKFELREDIRPAKTLYVQGSVFNAKDKKGIPAAVELIDNASGEVVNNVQTDETGFYFITLPIGKDYTFSVNRKGFFYYTDVYELSKKRADSTYKKDIALQPIELNASLTFQNIQFETNSFALLPVSHIELNKLVQLLNDNPTVRIMVSGHTDNSGKAATNQKLSEERAKAVVNYLVDKGIQLSRLSAKGFGSTKPVASNDTEKGKAVNRRTEFKITAL